MLPGPLFSVYQQYKKDTDSVASWLASTAKICGFPADLLAPVATHPKGSGRLKGKARKNAKKPNKSTPAPAETAPKYIIAIKDFVPLAEYICASTKPLISVPSSFAETINRVIHVRSSFGSQLAEHGVKPGEGANATHSYFVGILEKVRDVLRPRMPPDTPVASVEDLGNRFSGLNVYEPSQEFLDAPDIVRPDNAQGDDAVYEAEALKSLEDAIVAYTIMLNDINKIRSYITWIWSNYRDNTMDLANAALATNTGIDLARNLMDQIIPIFEDHGGVFKVAEKFSIVYAMQEGFSPDDIMSWGPDGGNEGVYEVADRTYLNASLLLRSLVNVLSPKNLPIYREGFFGTYNPESDRGSKSGRAKFKEDQIILAEFFTEAVTLARLVPAYPVEDEFVRGVRQLDKTGEMPFYLAYAAQILLDIHHTIRGHASSCLDTLIQHTSVMDNDLRSHLEFHETLKIDHWTASNDRVLQEFQKSIKWIAQDPVFVAKERVARRMGRATAESERHRILKNSPVICGLLLYHFRAGMYDIGIAVANAWGSITYSAHLYNALQQEGLLTDRWADMDVVQTLLGNSNFFVGDRPKTTEEYLKRYLLQMGYSASAFVRRSDRLPQNPGRHRSLASRAGPRGIKDVAPVSSMFIERYLRHSGQVDLSPEHVDEIISRCRFQEEGSEEDGTLVLSQIDDPEELRGKKSKLRQRKKAAEGGQLSPGQLVRSLALALGAETLEFSFPYLLMHRWSWHLLKAVKEECDPILRQAYTPAYIERESELPFVVGYIFTAATKSEGGTGDRLMAAAAEALNGLASSPAGSLVLRMASQLYGLNVEFEGEADEGSSD
ncbi:hypothetical protein ACJ41O_013231 [Fusarium nematophilum]